jgi:hypothetical protein
VKQIIHKITELKLNFQINLLSSLSTALNDSLLTKEIFVVLFVAECALMERNKLEKFMSQLKSFLDVSWIEKKSM